MGGVSNTPTADIPDVADGNNPDDNATQEAISETSTPNPTPGPTPVASSWRSVSVSLTFYVCWGAPAGFNDGFCGTQADGTRVTAGSVACGYGFTIGTVFHITGDESGRIYRCSDRGGGGAYWIDVWFESYAEGRAWRDQFGQYVEVVIVE